ncbi:MAG: hypothetical protein IKP95_03160 [Ruminococcus sp.]|nr:hypothetical protein [Ruminococcus sp.]
MLFTQAGFMPREAWAEGTVTYNANEYAPFKGRTAEETARRYSEALLTGATYSDGNSSTYYSEPCSVTAPYAPGVLTEDTLDAMLAMTNFYRWLSGTPEITVPCEPDESLQVQALVRNIYRSHKVDGNPQPEGMSDEMWNAGKITGHNVLAWGLSPQGSIKGWVNEGYDLNTGAWSSRGHRYALISPEHSTFRFGYCGNTSIGAYGGAAVSYKDTFSAFPMPGAMPAEAIARPARTSWGAEWESGAFTFTDIGSVTVTIKNLTTGQTYTRTSAAGTLVSEKSNRIEFVQAEDYNTSTNQYECPYEITITGLKDRNGSSAKITYTVEFFKAADLAPSKVVSATAYYNNLHISSKWMDEENLGKIAAGLPKTLNIKTESGEVYTMTTKNEWVYDAENSCFRTSADPADLPDMAVDTSGVLKDIRLTVQADDTCNKFSLTTAPSSESDINEGSELYFKQYIYIKNYSNTAVCRFVSDGEGGYSGDMVFDTVASPELDTGTVRNEHYLRSPTCLASDSGEYFTINYTPDSRYMDAYISGTTVSLNIVHKYSAQQTKDPTCTEEGVITYTCPLCGDSYTEPVPANGHDYTYIDTKTATCTSDGLRVYTCSACGDEYSEPVPALGHSYNTKVVPPTCTEDGYTLYTCSECGDSYKSDPVPTQGHQYKTKVLRDPTCTTPGLKKYTCQECGENYSEVIPALGHDLISKMIQPTCTEDGYTLHTCSRCTYSYKDSTVTTTGHKFVPKITTEPTCTEDGVRTFTCSECGESYTAPVPAEGHSYLDVVIAPTCTTEGYTFHICGVCGDSYTDSRVPPLISVESAVISLPVSRYDTFDAALITADVRVMLGDTELIDDEDMIVSVSKPDRQGYAIITAEGIGLYGGTVTKKVLIASASESFVLGDADRNGTAALLDYALMRLYVLTSYPVDIDLIAADLNNDKTVDEKDLELMMAYLVGADITVSKLTKGVE